MPGCIPAERPRQHRGRRRLQVPRTWPIQITGRANYAAWGEALGLDLIRQPELLELPQHAAMSAAWFWKQKGQNDLADKDQFNTITRRINGRLNGLQDRLEVWGRAGAVQA